MSLRRALDALPDDRATASELRSALSFLQAHEGEPVEEARMARATGVPEQHLHRLMQVLADAFVVDCASSECTGWVYRESSMLKLEVSKFLRTASSSDARLQRGAERFRNRFGPRAI